MGALTSKPYAFSARPWELSDIFSHDPYDTMHAPLRLSLRGSELLRVLPDLRFSSLNEWLSDRSRFSYDALAINRQNCFTFYFRGRSFSYLPSPNFLNYFFFVYLLAAGAGLSRAGLFSAERAFFTACLDSRFGKQMLDPHADFRLPTFAAPLDQALPTFTHLFIVGVSARYTHPTLFAYLKRIRLLGLSVFDFGEPNQLSDYSLGSSLHVLFDFLRFRSRLSSFYEQAAFLTSSRLLRFFPHCFPLQQTLALSESPAIQQSFEIGANNSFSGLQVFAKYVVSLSSHKTSAKVFSIPAAHPYESSFTAYSFASLKTLIVNQTVPTSNFFYDFFREFHSLSYNFSQQSFASFSLPLPSPLTNLYLNLYSSYNYYDHFAGSDSLLNSTNILLSLRRNEDYRHTHFCYF